VIMTCELYCCLLPQCEALRICRSGFPIATMPTHHTLECAQFRLNPESHWLVKWFILANRKFCKKYLFSVTSFWCTLVNLFVVAPHA